MTTLAQFAPRCKMRHDFSDMIQVRYTHSDGQPFDTWISGEEVLARLKTMSREQLIRSFSQMNWDAAKTAVDHEAERGKQKAKRRLIDKLADKVQDSIGGNIFGDTLADNLRGVDSNEDPRQREKQQWQARLSDNAFRAVALELAWINLRGSLPGETAVSPDDWV